MKRAFLTGASSGIGLATAQALLAAGHEVWGTSRDLDRLPQLKHFHRVQLDLRHNSEIDGAFVNALSEAGHFDVVINNAGSGHFGAAEFLAIDRNRRSVSNRVLCTSAADATCSCRNALARNGLDHQCDFIG